MKMHTQRGVTLIGVLFAVAASGAVVGAGILAIDTVLESRGRQATVASVEGQGAHALAQITRLVRSATDVSAPAAGGTGNSLSLTIDDGGSNPAVVDVQDGGLVLTRGGAETALTAGPVAVSSITFANRGSAAHGSVHIALTLSYASGSERDAYTYERTFYGSATQRTDE